jgi:alanine racemase
MIRLEDLLKATGGLLTGSARADQFSAFAYDSRRLKPGELFLAVQTPTGDGHDFIEQAISAGATGVLCRQPPPALSPLTTFIRVPDTQEALLDYARFILQKYRPLVIGVTGSNGKTTAKEAIAAVLQTRYSVFKNPGSYNGRYGLPIALGRLKAGHQMAVLEMACDSFGEIGEMVALTQPRIGVMTTISEAHLAGLGSVENVALEKGRLIESLPPDGTAVLNLDDIRVAIIKNKTNTTIITYGLETEADIRAVDIVIDFAGTRFTVLHRGNRYAGRVRLLGRHQLYPILAAVSAGLACDIPLEMALSALASLAPMPGRLNPLPGQKGSLILDDSFNANPASMKAGLDTLHQLGQGRTKIALLGKMADLGESEAEAQANVGRYLAGKVDRLVTFGEAGQAIAQAAQAAGMSPAALNIVYTPSDAVRTIIPYLSPETVLFAKASAEARLERVIAPLLAEPADRGKLARSEPGWERVRLGLPRRPTWVEIDLEALAGNVRCLKSLAGPAQLMAVLKADAYGHGAIKVARTALANGAAWLAAATLEEGLVLRRAGIDAPILVLGYMPAWQAGEAIRHNIRATVFSRSVLEAFSQTARQLNKRARVHLKVDTGLGRLGLLPAEVVPFIREGSLPGVIIEGLFTHFGQADEADLTPAQTQLHIFQAILTELDALNLRPPLVHAANTAAIINLPEAHFDMVRAGIGLYGLAPSPQTPLPAQMKPALSFKTTIAQVKTLPSGSPIGYGAIYRTQSEETIAIIPVGYADGFRRAPQTWGEVLVKGARAPLVGRVSMDQAAINISHIPNVRQGDEVVLIGRQGAACITAEDVAARLGTVNYEVVSEILARVPRVS